MNIAPVPTPLPGEHLIATSPTMRPDTDARWRQRLNYWAGRSLTAEALELDQENRAARLAWLGRLVTPGVISGLEVALEEPATPQTELSLDGYFLHVAAGSALAANGEDVVVPRPLRVALSDIPVQYLRVPRTDEFPSGEERPAGAEEPTPETQPRLSLGNSTLYLDRFPGGYIPWAAVLVLRPAELRTFGNFDPEDPCELDPSRDAFADERRVDAAQLRFCQLPVPWETLPLLANRGDATWRNRLAYAVFGAEAEDSPRQQLRLLAGEPGGDRWDTVLREGGLRPWELTAEAAPSALSLVRALGLFPWELLGAPVALFSAEQVGGTTNQRFFLDRGSVRRPGGRARPRSRPTTRIATNASDEALNPPGAGTSSLWRARVDQFAEHLASLEETDLTGQASHFRFLPPAGLLPKEALTRLTTSEAEGLGLTDRADASDFFPASFQAEATPIPIEDLDAALAASATLAPLDTTAPGEPVRLLVPLPERLFDPRLLVVEPVDPFFSSETSRLVGVRQDWRERRDYVRTRRNDLSVLATGPVPAAIAPPLEPGQLEAEPVESIDASGNLTTHGITLQRALVSPLPQGTALQLTPQGLTTRSLGATDALFLLVRLDQDAVPTRIEAIWLSGTQRFGFAWRRRFGNEPLAPRSQWLPEVSAPVIPPTIPSDPPTTRVEPGPGELWLRLDVAAGDLVTGARDLTGIELQVEGGRIAWGAMGILRNVGTPQVTTEVWFQPTDTGTVTAIGGDWTLIRGARLLAPFEEPYSPTFEDGETLDERLTDLDTQLRLATDKQVRNTGLKALVERLQQEVDKADDAIDLSFLKAQSNAHRARQVIMGEDAANELLTSPALNSIVESKSARVAQEKLLTAFKEAPAAGTRSGPTRAGPATLGAHFAGNVISVGGTGTTNIGSIRLDQPIEQPLSFQPPSTRPPILADPSILSPVVSGNFIASGANLAVAARVSDRIEISTGAKALLPSKQDVIASEPLIGQAFRIRTLSIAKRFNGGPALTAYDYAHAGFLDALALIRSLPLTYEPDADINDPKDPVPDIFLGPPTTPVDEGLVSFHRYATEEGIAERVSYRELVSDNERADLTFDQGTITARAIRRADATVLILRRLEYYTERRREQLRRAQEALDAIRAAIAAAEARLISLEAELAESRHDVSVARALWQEERQRVFDINEQRDALMRDEVKFLAYVRPRGLDTIRKGSPYWKLEQADTPAPLPACLKRHDEPDPALQAFLQLFRNAPARWFTELQPLLKKLDTRERLFEVLDGARFSAARFLGTTHEYAFTGKGNAALLTYTAQQRVITRLRERTAQTTLVASRAKAWTDFRREAEEHVSVGDLVDGRHGNTAVAKAAAAELEDIGQVGTCLHAEFASVAPGLRLAWVERFSQFDRPGLLRDLTVLPQYGRIERGLRRRLQEFVQWLFGRVFANDAEAVGLMNDYVRLCLLLASHAPVNQIIAGHVPRPTPVRPGIHIPLRPLNPLLVRVGMEFNVWHAQKVVARGTVEDLQDGEVQARVEKVEGTITTLDTSMEVRFIPPALSLRPQVKVVRTIKTR